MSVSVAVPEAPKHIHMKVEDSLLKLYWRRVENNGRPILKYTVRVSDLTGRILLEKVSYKPHCLPRCDDFKWFGCTSECNDSRWS